LELYVGLLARNAADSSARAGLSEVHERLLARAENALLEERWMKRRRRSKRRANPASKAAALLS